MEINANLHQKVLSQIIETHALTLSDARRVALCEDAELQAAFEHFVSLVSEKAQRDHSAHEPSVMEDEMREMPEVTQPLEEEPASDILSSPEPELPPTEETKTASPVSVPEETWKQAPFPSFDQEENPPPVTAKPVLKPGQVPSDADRLTVTPVLSAVSVARINIANARAGSLFHSEIDITLDNGEKATIQDVSFSQDIGLTFDPLTSSLQGTPAASGDHEIIVTWSSDDAQSHAQKVLFIVNPDPRSLWKIIDPPADDKYFKANVDHHQLDDNGIRIAAASRRGRSHEHVGSFRDDDFFISHCADPGWSIMLVADGAGSAKNSREGSRIVTETVGKQLTQYLGGERGRELKERVLNWSAEDQQVIGADFIKQFHQASKMAVNNINNASISTEEPVKSYSTTLLATVTLRTGAELFAASFWMGDGAIAAYGPAGKVRVLGTPDSGEYAGQTRFLDLEALQDPEFSKRIRIGKWPDISHLILMTDGVSDPYFETDNGLLKAEKWDALIAEIAPSLDGTGNTAEQLAEWLNFFSPGNHDDRTIIVYW